MAKNQVVMRGIFVVVVMAAMSVCLKRAELWVVSMDCLRVASMVVIEAAKMAVDLAAM